MKIVHKIILSNTSHVLSIAVLHFFVYEVLDLMAAKSIAQGNFKKVEGSYTGDQTLATYPF